jgi:hypothetical protein
LTRRKAMPEEKSKRKKKSGPLAKASVVSDDGKRQVLSADNGMKISLTGHNRIRGVKPGDLGTVVPRSKRAKSIIGLKK